MPQENKKSEEGLYTYGDRAFASTTALKPAIMAAARAVGVRPEAVYGALVEENHDFHDNRLKNRLSDSWTRWGSRSHDGITRDYRRAEQDDKLDRHSSWDKFNPVLNDIGPYNIKLGTAIRVLRDYERSTPPGQDPLALRRYGNDYPALARALFDGSAAPAIAALLLREGRDYMAQHAEPEHWQKLSPAEQDALAVTYYNMGPKQIADRRVENMRENQGKYKPKPGEKEAAGEAHEYNAKRIGEIFGNPDYLTRPANNTPTAPQPAPPPATEPPPAVTPRRPSNQLLRRHGDHEVELLPGGTLSDVIVTERQRGNPLTLDDLHAANGLTAEQDRRLPPGLILWVPRSKPDGTLMSNDGKTEVKWNRRSGEASIRQERGGGKTAQLSRRRDEQRQCLIDDYREAEANATLFTASADVAPDETGRLRTPYREAREDLCADVVSSHVARVCHNAAQMLLTIRFLNGSVYEYYLVPRQLYLELIAAPSKGTFLSRRIKGVYAYSQLE